MRYTTFIDIPVHKYRMTHYKHTHTAAHSLKSQLLVSLWIRPMGMFQPAVLPKPVWHDLLPCRVFQVTPDPFFATATAK